MNRRRRKLIAATAIAASALGVGCASEAPPAAKAANVDEYQCSGAEGSPVDLQVAQAAMVLDVEPLYLHDTCAGTAQVAGTKLLLRRPTGASTEQVAQVIRCASARATLGRVDPSKFPNNIFGLPGAWVDVDVTGEGDHLAVTLRADSIPHNIQLLRRASAFFAAERSRLTPVAGR